MSIPREGSRDTDKGILISKYPDWCKTPDKPIPYTIYAKQNNDANTAPTVRLTGKRSHTKGSIITTCSGDEAGIGRGVKSGTKESICQPKTWSKTVRFEGKNVVRHSDEWFMNNKNTTGKMTYVEDTEIYKLTPPLIKNEEDRYSKQVDVGEAQSLVSEDLANSFSKMFDNNSILADHGVQVAQNGNAKTLPSNNKEGLYKDTFTNETTNNSKTNLIKSINNKGFSGWIDNIIDKYDNNIIDKYDNKNTYYANSAAVGAITLDKFIAETTKTINKAIAETTKIIDKAITEATSAVGESGVWALAAGAQYYVETQLKSLVIDGIDRNYSADDYNWSDFNRRTAGNGVLLAVENMYIQKLGAGALGQGAESSNWFKGAAKNVQITAQMRLSILAGKPIDLNTITTSQLNTLEEKAHTITYPEAYNNMQAVLSAKAQATSSENVRVTGATTTNNNNNNNKCPCLVGPYKEILPKCRLQCGPTAQAHHIVADKTFRIGTRNDKTARIPTIGDYKPLPTLKNGAAICLDGMASVKGTAHNIAHQADLWVKNLGHLSEIKGLASIRKIADLYMESAIFARPDCADLIIAEVNKSLDGTNPNAMGRTTTSPITQGSPAHNKLNGIGLGSKGK